MEPKKANIPQIHRFYPLHRSVLFLHSLVFFQSLTHVSHQRRSLPFLTSRKREASSLPNKEQDLEFKDEHVITSSGRRMIWQIGELAQLRSFEELIDPVSHLDLVES